MCCAAALGAVMILVVVLLSAAGAILVLGAAVAAFVLRRSNYTLALLPSYPFTLPRFAGFDFFREDVGTVILVIGMISMIDVFVGVAFIIYMA